MKNTILICLMILTFFSIDSYAQESKIKAGDKKYHSYDYIDAIKTYEKVANKGYKSVDMFKRLGNAYYFNSDFEGAAKWYGELFAMNTGVESDYYYRYGQSLKSTGQIEKAKIILTEFDTKSQTDNRARFYSENVNYLDQIKANTGRYKIENSGINSKFSDYGTFLHNNKLYFASARDTGNFSQRKHKWTNEYFTNLYLADTGSIKVCKLKSSLNTKFHESTPVFTKNGKTVYFTRNNYVDGKKGKDGEKNTLIKIYRASLQDGKWINIESLPFASDNYSTGHPALSSDEKTLYFASDMPGTLGQSDIYKVSISNNGDFGSPENLGKSINTEGKETFPFVTNENQIYFASDGHPGLGGLDVFVGDIDSIGKIVNIQNLGADVNSPKDDFAYIIDSNTRKGYFSSSKDGGKGSDDIYKFIETKKLKCIQELNGTITDIGEKFILPGSKVVLYENMVIKNTAIADSEGNYVFPVECGKNYNIRVAREGYETKEVSKFISKASGKTSCSISLDPIICKVAIGDDLGKCFKIKTIYFDLNKFNITEEAALDLEKILIVLNENPSMELDIRSHTDSRGSFKYNQSLSDRRAKSTIQWLVKNGIDKNRLTGKGNGETQLMNKCSDGELCSENEHQENRRVEFLIKRI